jgi:RNA polymerase sigma factor
MESAQLTADPVAGGQLTTRGELPARVHAAKEGKHALNTLLRDYVPFIKKCVSDVVLQGQARRDYLTEAMLGFIQSVKTYNEEKGAFIPYAQIVIRNRLINAAKKEAAIQKQNGKIDLQWEYETAERQYTEFTARKEAQMEIRELNDVFARWDFTWRDLVKNCPKQSRSRDSCHQIVRALLAEKPLLNEMLRTNKLPIQRLSVLSGHSEKTLEKYRRYISALVLIMEGDYPYVRSFLPQFFDKEGTL